ncbi:uncharacterized protein TNCV_4716901 [Trichonephila clavipes]|nr:uncharacterized protein TNCV_4716901 [Trichonephila clavipes]
MMVPVVQSVNGLFNARFIVWETYHTRLRFHNARHRAARPAWAREHRDTSIEDRKRVAWSDESRFRLLNVDGRLKVGRQAHEVMDPVCYDGTVQEHSGSIMVFGAFYGTLWCVYQPPPM